MKCARWTASVGIRLESFAALAVFVVADSEVACEQKDLLPVLVDEGRGGIDARCETKQAGPAATLLHLLQPTRKDFLPDASPITRRGLPAPGHSPPVKLIVGLVYSHSHTPAYSSDTP